MSRPPRYLTIGPANHVISHAVGDLTLFREDDDFRFFLRLLDETSDRGGFDLYHYALMTNHFHLQISSPADQKTYSAAIKRMLHLYSLRHREKYKRAGNLWRPRFKNFKIDNEAYLMTSGAYIELNPVRAGMVSGAADYRWSSARFYLRGEKNALITPDPAFLSLATSEAGRRERYADLVALWQANAPDKQAAKRFFRSSPATLALS